MCAPLRNVTSKINVDDLGKNEHYINFKYRYALRATRLVIKI